MNKKRKRRTYPNSKTIRGNGNGWISGPLSTRYIVDMMDKADEVIYTNDISKIKELNLQHPNALIILGNEEEFKVSATYKLLKLGF